MTDQATPAKKPTYHSEVTENGDNIQVENTPEYTAQIAASKKAADDAAAKKASDLSRTGMGSKFKEIDDYLSANPNQSEYTDPKTGLIYSRYTDTGGGGYDSGDTRTGETTGYNSFDPKSKMIGIYDTSGNRTSYKKQEPSKGFLGDLMSSPIMPILIGVLAPELLPSLGAFAAPAANAALQLAQGNGIEGALKGGALSYAGGQLGNYVTGEVGGALSNVGGTMDNIDVGGGWNPATGAASPLASASIAKAAGNAAKSVVQSGGKIDPKSLITSALSGAGDMQIGDSGINVGDALKGVQAVQAISGGNPLALASIASQYLPSGKTSTGPSARDVEPDSFPTTSGDKFPTPFTVDQSPLASQQDQETPSGGLNAVKQQISNASDTAQNTISDIKPTLQKIISGIGTAKSLQSAAQGSPLSAISAFTNIAKNASSAQPSSVDKLPPARADVRTLFPVGDDNPPAYVPPSKLTPITSIAGLSKLLSHTG